MALFGNFGKAIGVGLGILGGRTGVLGQAGQFGQALLSGFLPAQGPIAQTPQFGGGFEPTPVMSGVPRIAGMAGALAVMIQPILIRIATFLGRRTLSLRETLKIIRRMGRSLTPAAIAAAIGISVADLGILIMAGAQMPSRRMNPGNVKALRRSMRRIESFHRLCQKADTLRGRGRRSSRRGPLPRPGVQVVRAG